MGDNSNTKQKRAIIFAKDKGMKLIEGLKFNPTKYY